MAEWTEFTNTLRAEQLIKFVNKFIVSTLLKREVQKPLKDFVLHAKISGFFFEIFRQKLKMTCGFFKKSVKCSTRPGFHGPSVNLVFKICTETQPSSFK